MPAAGRMPLSRAIALAVLVIDTRGALMASCSVILWSIRFSVTLNTELMIVDPPGRAVGDERVTVGREIIVGTMLLRGRLPGCTSL